MKKPHIILLLGTGRQESRSAKVASWVQGELEKRTDLTHELVEVAKIVQYTVTVPPWGKGGADEKITPWKEVVMRSDGFIIVSPEYNHGYPGELKLLLDSLYSEYEKKPAGIISVSTGLISGARMTEQLRLILLELGIIPLRKAVHVAKVKETFTGASPSEAVIEKKFSNMVDDLVWFTDALRRT